MSEWRDLPGEPASPAREPDPWSDQPRWSDAEEAARPPAAQPAAGDPSSALGPEPAASAESVASGASAAAPAGSEAEPRTCPWCSTPAVDEATTCSSCGAALAQREKIGDLLIPGLTAVDPALEDYDKRPLHLRGPSPSQGLAPGIMIAAAAGGPIGLAAIGGIAAVAAVELAGARGPDGQPIALEDVGRPSEAVLKALQRLEEGTLPDPAKDEEKRESMEGSDG